MQKEIIQNILEKEKIKKFIFFRWKDNKSRQRKIVKLLTGFFLCMLLFTILSRFTDSLTIAQVQTESPAGRVIEHKVTSQGKAKQNQEIAIVPEEGLRIKSIAVHIGDTVEKGDVLAKFDLGQLSETIAETEKEILSLQLTNEALDKNRENQENARNREIRHARENYQDVKNSSADAVKKAKEEWQEAKKELEKAKKEKKRRKKQGQKAKGEIPQADTTQDAEQSMDELKSFVDEKESAYEEAKNNQKSSLKESRQAVENASAPIDTDNTNEINDLSIGTLEKKLARLEKIKKQQGKIRAKKSGVITEISAAAGSKTAGEAIMQMADISAGIRFVAQFAKEDEKYLSSDASVSLSKDGETADADGLSIASVTENTEDDSLLDVTVLLDGGSFSIGQTAQMTVSCPSARYLTTVPLSALREEMGRYYILSVQKKETVLGEEWFAQRTDVTVLDKNEEYAALKEGVLNEESAIIISSNKMVEDGDRIRAEK